MLSGISRGRAAIGLAAAAFFTVSAASASSITFEAESANQATKPFRIEFDRQASGGHCIVQPLHSGRPPAVSCSATYKIQVPAAGKYHLWGRAWWPNGCANSVDVQMDSGRVATLGQDGTYTRWHWVPLKGVSYELTAGVHQFKMMNREDGPEMDEFYLTTDEDYVPAGVLKPTPAVIVR